MARFWVAMGLGGAAAVLAACDTPGVAQVTADEAVLCPGGRDCPADGTYVGLLLPGDSLSAAVEGQTQLAATPSEAGAVSRAMNIGATGAPLRIQGPAPQPPQPPIERVCPQEGHAKCFANQSGMEWRTAAGQIQCNPLYPCVPGPAHGGGQMPAGYAGWLCKKASPTARNCEHLPQRRH